MDQNIQKALWLGVGVLLFVAVVSTGLVIFNKGRAVADKSSKQLDVMSKTLSESNLEPFNNEETTGSDVVNLIKSYTDQSGEFIIHVTTKYPSSRYYISSGSVSGVNLSSKLTQKNRATIDDEIKQAKDVESSQYINPSGKFYARLIYDKNDVVKGVVCEQQ